MRDVRRITTEPEALDRVTDNRPTPSEIVSKSEQLERVKTSLTPEEHQIFELRAAGMSWDEVATQLAGEWPCARRMQLSRGLERLERRLGLKE